MPKTGYVKLLAVYLASDLTLDTMTNGIKEIMDAITTMVDAEHERVTKDIRDWLKNATDFEDEDTHFNSTEFIETHDNLINERIKLEEWMVRLARIEDTANVLPRDFLKAIDVYPSKLL